MIDRRTRQGYNVSLLVFVSILVLGAPIRYGRAEDRGSSPGDPDGTSAGASSGSAAAAAASKTTSGSAKPAAPAAKPASPAARSASPAAQSASPAAQPASPAAQPSAPAAKHAAPAARPASPAAQPAAPAAGKPRAYTNEDLLKFARPEDRQADPAAAQQAAKDQNAFNTEAQKKDSQAPATEAYWAKLKRDAEERVKAAEERLEQIKWLALSEKNPLVAPPALTDEQKKERENLALADRARKSQEEIKAAEQDLEAARASLRDVLSQISQVK